MTEYAVSRRSVDLILTCHGPDYRAAQFVIKVIKIRDTLRYIKEEKEKKKRKKPPRS